MCKEDCSLMFNEDGSFNDHICNPEDPPEEWREIPDCKGGYAVSNYGEVLSLPKPNYKSKPLLLKQSINGYGYPVVTLSIDGKTNTRYVHCHVAAAFLGPRPDGFDICHNDGVKTNPEARNLRYDTRKENVADTMKHGGIYFGEDHHGHKYSDDQVREIRKLLLEHSPAEIARMTEYPIKYVCEIKAGKRRKTV